MKKILVTGGAGFIGSNLTHTLLNKGYQVKVIDDLSTGNLKNLDNILNRIDFIKGSILSTKLLNKAFTDIDIVFHQAAVPSVKRSIDNPARSQKVNVNGTRKILEFARKFKVNRVIYASSSSIYGNQPGLPKKEEMKVAPISIYALTKYYGERLCQLYYSIFGLKTICLRYFNVFGPRQNPLSEYSAVIPNFITAILNEKRPEIYGDGKQSRDFTFIENVVKGNIKAMKTNKGFGEVFNIACNKRITVNGLWRSLKEMSGTSIRVIHSSPRQYDVLHSQADISKANKILKYTPVIGFETGLKKTFKWYKKQPQKHKK